MFKRYTHAGAFSDSATPSFKFPIVSNSRGVEQTVYGKTAPQDVNIRKFYISNTKALNSNNMFVDTRTYGPSFFYSIVETESEVENIKSFINSAYFKQLYS